MKVDVLNMDGKKVRTVELPANIFEAQVNADLMHQAYVRQMANARLGTHNTKGRSEVSGGGRKPWRQKGTGRARQGSIRAPQWVGGGKVHTPKPRNYNKAMPRKMRRAALRSVLTARAADNALVVLDELVVTNPKTGTMKQVLNQLVGDSSVLILIPESNADYDLVYQTTNNLPDAKVLHANYLNIRDLLSFDKLLMPVKTLEVIESYLG
ncbi:MAG: 50S ribosomal protein L4 [Anaerolineales bacterium]|nr:MAG: 50S ribosomal protein L4 [Anaerolineales bacterium]